MKGICRCATSPAGVALMGLAARGQRRKLVAASLMAGVLLVSRHLVGETLGRSAAIGAAGGSIVLGAVFFVLSSGGFASSFRRSSGVSQ